MATEYVPALPEGYVYVLKKEGNRLLGWSQPLPRPSLVLDEETMTWRELDLTPAPVHPALDSSTC